MRSFLLLFLVSLFTLLSAPLFSPAQPITCSDQPICEMANKAAYIVRLTKEGPTTFVAKCGKQETPITFDIKPGDKYYLRCELPWGINPKPKLTEVKKEEAESYFDNVK